MPKPEPVITVEVQEVLVQVRVTRKHDGRPASSFTLPIAKVPAAYWPTDRTIPLVIVDELDSEGRTVRDHLEWQLPADIEKRLAMLLTEGLRSE